jgi:hypothetical protein
MTDDDICGAECADETPCQHPAGSCPVASHSDPNAENAGRPAAFDDERRRELVLTAVRAGLTIADQAAHAKVHPKTLRRRLCCVETPSEPSLTTEQPCQFCRDYVHAHGDGAIQVLEQCRPEFRASASFGYHKTEGREVSGEGGGPVEVTFTEEVVETSWSGDE